MADKAEACSPSEIDRAETQTSAESLPTSHLHEACKQPEPGGTVETSSGNSQSTASAIRANGESAHEEVPAADSVMTDSGDSGAEVTGADPAADGAAGEQQLSKNRLRKLRHRERLVAARRARRSEEKRRRRQRDAAAQSAAAAAGQLVSKRERRRAELERLRAARRDGLPAVCVDLQYGDRMSEKEQSRLVTQLGRLYGANRAAARPLRLLLTSLAEEGPLHARCRRLVDGFDRLELERSAERPERLFAPEQLVYLSPDADTELARLDERSVYVIGGLVDETVQGGVSRARAAAAGLRTARLPTAAHLQHAHGTRACVLTVNQVFVSLLRYRETGDWRAALTAAVPPRKGFTPRSDDAAAESGAAAADGEPPVGGQ